MQAEPRQRLRAPERREALLDAALGLFAGADYGAVSVGEIAAASGVTKPVLYEHFESKTDLYVALGEREAAALSATLLASFDPEALLEERLRTLAGDAIRHARRLPDSVGLLLQDPRGEPAVAAAHEAAREVARSTTAAAIVLDPLFEPSPGLSRRASAELHADLQVAVLERILRWALAHPNHSTRSLADFFVNVLWRGLGAEGDAGKATPDLAR
jgi:AcrR family transcriptional regulator